MTTVPIFFLHSPKAGGSSLRSMLTQISGTEAAPNFGSAPNGYRAIADDLTPYAGHNFYAGHYGYDVFRALQAGHFLVTNFRDPIQRVRSLYQYWRLSVPVDSLNTLLPGDAELVMLAKNKSFSEFIRHDSDDLRLNISNSHFRQLYKSNWSWEGNTWLSRKLVKQRISNMRWFYVAETPEASHLLLTTAFPAAASVKIDRHNKSLGEIITVNEEDARYISQINKLDFEIYAHAVRVQSDRLIKLR